MSQATEILPADRAPHARIVGAVSAAHFVSHYYILLLAPLLLFVREDFGVTYTEVALAITAFNVVSAVLQTPAGFLVDRLGARIILIAGLVIGAGAFIVAGLTHSFWIFVLMFGLAGVGNTVYHPADYALLSQHVPNNRIGQAFSVHTFAGMLGSGLAPVTLLLMQNWWGWRGAFIGAGLVGFAVAALLLIMRDTEAPRTAPVRADEDDRSAAWQLLMSPPILLNLVFFILLAMISGGLHQYSVVALGALHGTPVTIANGALTVYLLMSAFGVLVGGYLVTRTDRHGTVAGGALAIMAALTVLVGSVDLGSVLLIAVMTVNGLFFGIMMPSRDMIVRDVTPPGQFGKVFGFVTTGFNIGGIVSPLIFGAIMDHGSPRFVFYGAAAFCLASIATVVTRPAKAARPD